MSLREVRGIREPSLLDDGDTIRLRAWRFLRGGRRDDRIRIPPSAITTSGLLRVRLLGIDTPEARYPGDVRYCPAGCTTPVIRPAIPPQEPWATRAKQFLDAVVPADTRVVIELSDFFEVFDQRGRVLAWLWTADRLWRKQSLVNRELVREGHAFPFQIWPNLAKFALVKDVAKQGANAGRGVFGALTEARLSLRQTFDETQAQSRINEPFVYRRVVDATLCGCASPVRLFYMPIGDARTFEYRRASQYSRVPVEYRVYFKSLADARSAGFQPAQ